MKAIIMAAGKGSRISEKIHGLPKCILPLPDGEPIIRRTIKMMLELEITPVLCIGYKGDQIKKTLDGLAVRYYENPFFAVTNNIASVWFCLSEFNGSDDILLLSGDLFYPKDYLSKAKTSRAGLSMFVDSGHMKGGDYFFHRDAEGWIDLYGSQLPLDMREYENVGIAKISADFTLSFADEVKEIVREGRYQTYFEEALLRFSKKRRVKIDFIDVCGSFWHEFDYYEDYQFVLEHERVGGK